MNGKRLGPVRSGEGYQEFFIPKPGTPQLNWGCEKRETASEKCRSKSRYITRGVTGEGEGEMHLRAGIARTQSAT